MGAKLQPWAFSLKVDKGQLISKCSFGVFVWTKISTNENNLQILEFEKLSNHKIKALYI